MQVGDRVRVKESVIMYHHPEHRNQPFDIKGLEGEITKSAQLWQGKEISANYPFFVKFEKKFSAHLHESELEIID